MWGVKEKAVIAYLLGKRLNIRKIYSAQLPSTILPTNKKKLFLLTLELKNEHRGVSDICGAHPILLGYTFFFCNFFPLIFFPLPLQLFLLAESYIESWYDIEGICHQGEKLFTHTELIPMNTLEHIQKTSYILSPRKIFSVENLGEAASNLF